LTPSPLFRYLRAIVAVICLPPAAKAVVYATMPPLMFAAVALQALKGLFAAMPLMLHSLRLR